MQHKRGNHAQGYEKQGYYGNAQNRGSVGNSKESIPETVYHVKKWIVIGNRFPEFRQGVNGKKNAA